MAPVSLLKPVPTKEFSTFKKTNSLFNLDMFSLQDHFFNNSLNDLSFPSVVVSFTVVTINLTRIKSKGKSTKPVIQLASKIKKADLDTSGE